jgi:hypothetical protein
MNRLVRQRGAIIWNLIDMIKGRELMDKAWIDGVKQLVLKEIQESKVGQ